jgi:hypothetical protein
VESRRSRLLASSDLRNIARSSQAFYRKISFDKPVVGWVCGVTGEVVCDTVQKVLVGRPGQEGTGAIPKDAIVELVSARGIPDLLDTIKVNHCPTSSMVMVVT